MARNGDTEIPFRRKRERVLFCILGMLVFAPASYAVLKSAFFRGERPVYATLVCAWAPISLSHAIIIACFVPLMFPDMFGGLVELDFLGNRRQVAMKIMFEFCLSLTISYVYRLIGSEVDDKILVGAYTFAIVSFCWSRLVAPGMHLQFTCIFADFLLCLGLSKTKNESLFVPFSILGAFSIFLLKNVFEYRDARAAERQAAVAGGGRRSGGGNGGGGSGGDDPSPPRPPSLHTPTKDLELGSVSSPDSVKKKLDFGEGTSGQASSSEIVKASGSDEKERKGKAKKRNKGKRRK